jgi:hypothetical protein
MSPHVGICAGSGVARPTNSRAAHKFLPADPTLELALATRIGSARFRILDLGATVGQRLRQRQVGADTKIDTNNGSWGGMRQCRIGHLNLNRHEPSIALPLDHRAHDLAGDPQRLGQSHPA